jgi:hypothetical protein
MDVRLYSWSRSQPFSTPPVTHSILYNIPTAMNGYVLVRPPAPTHNPPSQGRFQILYIFHDLQAANQAFDQLVASFRSQGRNCTESYWNTQQAGGLREVSVQNPNTPFNHDQGELWIDTTEIRDACVEENSERNRILH